MDRKDEALELLNDIKHLDDTLEAYRREESKTAEGEYMSMLEENEKALLERKTAALRCIKKMKPMNQRLIMLRYFEKKTKEEIGQIVGYSYRSVWRKIHEAEGEFMEIYAKQDIELHKRGGV